MPFFYTDDAIVSGSPTGRHLSTIIKRPVVLMSGWDEHAAAVCTVLNSLQPDHPVGTQYAQWCDGEGLPYTADYSGIEGRALKAAHAVLDALPKGIDLQSFGVPYAVSLQVEDLKEKLEHYQARSAASDERVARLSRELLGLQADLKKPVEVTAETARHLFYAVPGATLSVPGNPHTFKRV